MRVNITSKNDLTTVSNATETIKTIASKIGTERIAYIHPNCGLRGTEKSLALRILRSILELSSIVL
jgi:methionine synthase II (cobalamin-independent)